MQVLDDPSNHQAHDGKTTSPFDDFMAERVEPLITEASKTSSNNQKPYLDKFVGLKKQQSEKRVKFKD